MIYNQMISSNHTLHGVILDVDQSFPWQPRHVVLVFLHLIQHPTNILIINISIIPKFQFRKFTFFSSLLKYKFINLIIHFPIELCS